MIMFGIQLVLGLICLIFSAAAIGASYRDFYAGKTIDSHLLSIAAALFLIAAAICFK